MLCADGGMYGNVPCADAAVSWWPAGFGKRADDEARRTVTIVNVAVSSQSAIT